MALFMLTAVAFAAPKTGTWKGGVTATTGSQTYDVRYGYAPNDHPSRVSFKVAKHGKRLKSFKVTVPVSCEGLSGPPATDISVASAKIKRRGKFKRTVTEPVEGFGDGVQATVKLSGKLKRSKGRGKFSVKVGSGTCKYAFKAKRKG
jgi:hypothetical protein